MTEVTTTRWAHTLILVAASMLALMVIVILVSEVLAAHAQPADAPAAWQSQLLKVDEALGRKDVSGALHRWQEAYAMALGSRRWEAMIDVGDAYRRIGAAGNFVPAAVARARKAYLAALFRARDRRSLDGILRAAEAFAELGDREVVEQCIRIAEGLAAGDRHGGTLARVRAFADRWADRSLAAGELRVEP